MKKELINNDISPDENSAQDYLSIHKNRYEYLLDKTKNLREKFSNKSIRILDIGPSVFTQILEKSFPEDEIISLGFEHDESRGSHLPKNLTFNRNNFYNFNLNDSRHQSNWIALPKSDIIIMAEVLEHLFTAPSLVLTYLEHQLNENGFLIIQTPNAAALKNRIRLMLGKNPFEMIRENADNPGHFREYTFNELTIIAKRAGFEVYAIECRSYFGPRNLVENIYMKITNFLPQTFRDGITIILKK